MPPSTSVSCMASPATRSNTWTTAAASEPWPQSWLPSRLRGTHIISYGYDAYVARASTPSNNRLLDHATSLLHDLTADRAWRGASSRPIIFVAHGFGGLVCKQAVLLSRNNPHVHLRDVFDHVHGMAFLGTPHNGPWMADWAQISAQRFGIAESTDVSLLQALQTDKHLLEAVQLGFLSVLRDPELASRLQVSCFFEELPMPEIGTIVTKSSATMDGHVAVSIRADHESMTKFSSPDDTGFKRLLAELVRWEQQTRYGHAPTPDLALHVSLTASGR